MEFFKVYTVGQVHKELTDAFSGLSPGKEVVDLAHALDRVAAQDIESPHDVPDFSRSTVDGYAVRSFDTHGSSESVPSMLRLTGEVFIGKSTDIILSPGLASYIPTGGMIPSGADSVVMIEHINRLDDEYIEVYKPVSPGENIMFAGDDMKKGETAIKRGRIISPLDIGALAATGKTRIEVYKRLVFYIISTGDEIIEPSRNTDYGMVRDINGYTLQALVRKSGGEVIKRTIVRDDYGLLREELEKASELADIVLISGGSSVGTRDFTPDIINSFGNRGVFVHGIAIKPGKPTIVGKVKNKAVFGLPGHPVSAVIVYKVIVEHLINHLYGINRQVQSIKAVISTNVHSSPGSRTYRMVSLNTKNGVQYADVIYGKSGMITLLSKACGYIVIDENEEGLNRGKEVEVYLL